MKEKKECLNINQILNKNELNILFNYLIFFILIKLNKYKFFIFI